MSSILVPPRLHEPRRHRNPRARYCVRNRPDDDRCPVRPGDIRIRLLGEMIAGLRATCRITPGRRRCFSRSAIETALIPCAIFWLPPRQTEIAWPALMKSGQECAEPSNKRMTDRQEPAQRSAKSIKKQFKMAWHRKLGTDVLLRFLRIPSRLCHNLSEG
jgi:hypothetical protein